jgi:hypothetical protein
LFCLFHKFGGSLGGADTIRARAELATVGKHHVEYRQPGIIPRLLVDPNLLVVRAEAHLVHKRVKQVNTSKVCVDELISFKPIKQQLESLKIFARR